LIALSSNPLRLAMVRAVVGEVWRPSGERCRARRCLVAARDRARPRSTRKSMASEAKARVAYHLNVLGSSPCW
jgi:hypothetical protein